MSSTPSPHWSTLVDRLRARPLSSWSYKSPNGAGDWTRLDIARAAIAEFAEVGWRAERLPGEVPAVPDLGPSAVADQLAVLISDAARAGVPREQLDGRVRELADALGVRLD
jgi:hypothetical protein